MQITAREAALQILDLFENQRRGIRQNKTLHQEEESLIKKVLSKDKALFTMLYKGIIRWMARLDSIIAEFSDHKLDRVDSSSLNSLRIGLYEIMRLHRIPDYASVNEAVNLIENKGKKAKAFVNGVLREIIRNREKIPLIPTIKNTQECIRYHLSYPPWLADLFLNQFGKENALKAAQSLNEEEPITVRVNFTKIDKQSLKDRLKIENIQFEESGYSESSLIIEGKLHLDELKPYKEDLFYIQNTSSQIVSYILDPKQGESILDCCAGPGGKTTHILELTQNKAHLFAMDISKEKLQMIQENAINLGATNLTTILGDASKSLPPDFRQEFDRILVDAPCSALGTIRKNPEIKWLKDQSDVKRLSKLQSQILNNMKGYLKKCGTLVYSVCTFTKEETTDVVSSFLENSKDFTIDPIIEKKGLKTEDFITKEGFLLIPPLKSELESFFIARLKKT